MYVEPIFTIYWKDYVRKNLKQIWKYSDHAIDYWIHSFKKLMVGGMNCECDHKQFAICLDNLEKRWENPFYLKFCRRRDTFEQDVARVICHEHMHLILQIQEDERTSRMLDNVIEKVDL